MENSLCENCRNLIKIKYELKTPIAEPNEYYHLYCLILKDKLSNEGIVSECNKFIKCDRIEYCDDLNCDGHLIKEDNLIRPCNG